MSDKHIKEEKRKRTGYNGVLKHEIKDVLKYGYIQ